MASTPQLEPEGSSSFGSLPPDAQGLVSGSSAAVTAVELTKAGTSQPASITPSVPRRAAAVSASSA